MYGIEVVVEWLDVVFVYGGEGVVGFSESKQNGMARTGGDEDRSLDRKFALSVYFLVLYQQSNLLEYASTTTV